MNTNRSNRALRYGVSAALFGSLALTPSLAFAAEENLGAALLIPQLSEFIPMLIVFVIIWGIIAKVAWPAIAGTLDKRAATIKDSLETAEAARIEAEQLLEEYKQQLAEARRESAEILSEAKRAGENVRNDILAKAQVEAEDMVENARKSIENEKQAAIAELRNTVADLSVSVAGRIIQRDLDPAEHKRVIESYLAEVGNIDEN